MQSMKLWFQNSARQFNLARQQRLQNRLKNRLNKRLGRLVSYSLS
ncbi:MAG TPA: hypothetical protein VFV28_05895 [Limnobacter sp.]|nr:hypothetical protein [Limnobacter sp.]